MECILNWTHLFQILFVYIFNLLLQKKGNFIMFKLVYIFLLNICLLFFNSKKNKTQQFDHISGSTCQENCAEND